MDMCVGEERQLFIRMANGIVWCKVKLLDINNQQQQKIDL